MAASSASLAALRARWRRASGAPLALALPALAVAVIVLLPVVYLVIRTAGAGTEAWDLLLSAQTLSVFIRSALLALAVTVSCVVLAVPVAWLTVRTDVPGRGLLSVATVLPLAVPSYVGGFALIATLGPRGLLQQALSGPFGVERLPEIYGFPGAWLALTLFAYPYVVLPVRAALWGMDPALEEASRGLGHGPWSTFSRVTLRHLHPAIAAGSLLVALYVLSDFGAVSLLHFNSFTRVIYVQYESSFDRTLASLLSLVLVAFALVLLLAEQRVRGRGRYYQVGSGVAGTTQRVRLGKWRWPAFGLCAGMVLVALGIPFSSLLYWLAQGIAQNESLGFVGQAAWNALYASAIAAGAAVVAAVPVVMLNLRHAGRLSGIAEKASFLGFGAPPIVIALALVFFAANYAAPLYQTLLLLVVAYVVRFLPEAIGAIRTSAIQVNPALEEAARSLGRSPLAALLTITLPLIRPGVVVAAALVFLTAMKELPATLILSPIGFNTLATELWSAADGAFFARAAMPGLILMAVSAIPVALLLLQERRRGV